MKPYDHIVFQRPLMQATYYAHTGMVYPFAASGDSWADAASLPYGHDCPIAPGHYELGQVDNNGPNCLSEGPFQIWVLDLSDITKMRLLSMGATADPSNGTLNIGGSILSRGGIAKYHRSEVMIHGGGSNLGAHALDPYQPLLKTYGCTRVHNADLQNLALYVNMAHGANVPVIFSVQGDPKKLSG